VTSWAIFCIHQSVKQGTCSFLLMISHASHGFSFSSKNQRSFNTSDFKALVETQLGKKIKFLRTDNEGEYVNHEIHNIFHEVGIQLQHTVSYTLQQNEVVERKNRSLKEMASSMLHAKSLPQRLCSEALNCVTYIQNRSSHKSVKDKTPYEAWSGLKPKVTHFRIFGSCAWAKISSEKRNALDPQTTECIFVGYSDGVKRYRLIDLSSD
jgi:hypothetical protein